LAVTVTPPLPAGRTLGERELRTGRTITEKLLVSATFWALLRVTEYLPQMAIRPAGTEAVTVVSLTAVVASGVPDQLTTAPETKELTFTVIVKAGPPASIGLGLMEVMAGVEV
jgi:hypothetical protein